MIGVVLENLVKTFDGVAVVDGASLEIRPGELAFVLGPSAAGKTTLARLVAGLDTLDDGEIYFDGRLVQQTPPLSRRVGFVFQGDALWPHLSVIENVEYPLKARGLPRRDRRARATEALAASRLESIATRRPDSLTTGQQQRVALARALVAKPALLILDDPLGRVPDRDRGPVRDEIRRVIAEAEVTTLITTTDPREALSMADRLAVMDLGKVLQAGDPSSVYNRPVDPFVARFLGPTNLIQGQVESTDARGDVVVRTPLGRLIGRGIVGDALGPPRSARLWRGGPAQRQPVHHHRRAPGLPRRDAASPPPRGQRLADRRLDPPAAVAKPPRRPAPDRPRRPRPGGRHAHEIRSAHHRRHAGSAGRGGSNRSFQRLIGPSKNRQDGRIVAGDQVWAKPRVASRSVCDPWRVR